ncbi:MAG: hypothetical protein ACK4VN_00815 [Bacteroidales bacterium]
MKAIIFFFLLICSFSQVKVFSSETFSDFKNDTSVSIGVGKTVIPSLWGGMKRNPSLVVGCRKQFYPSFAFEAFYQYAQNDNFPTFFNNQDQLHEAILMGDLFDSVWEEIYLHSIGIKAHFVLSGKGRWFFSVYLGGGAFNSFSSYHSLTEALFVGDQMVDYENLHVKRNNVGVFHMPGLLLNYQVYGNWSLGCDLSLFRFIDFKRRGLYTTYDYPVLPQFYSALLSLGFKF